MNFQLRGKQNGFVKNARMAVGSQSLQIPETISYRRISAAEDFESIGELRRTAFDAKDIYARKFGKSVIEPLDLDPATYVFGVYDRSRLVSTLRVNVLNAAFRQTPAMDLFSSVLNPLLDQGMSFIDPSRFAIDPDAGREIPALPLITLRLGHLATDYFNANYCLAAVKWEHRAFYRRVFKATLLAGPIVPGGMKVKAILMGGSRQSLPDIAQRYPLFRFTQLEQRLLFAKAAGGLPPLSIVPTAHVAEKVA